ncbi:MAG: hypothetical protein ACK4IX_03990 [Candidatus Sericytochromatia bacterium]
MSDLIKFNHVRDGSFWGKNKEEKIGNAEVLQSAKVDNKNTKNELEKQIRNSEIDGKNNVIISSLSNTTKASIVNITMDKNTLSKVDIGDFVKLSNNVIGTVEFIDSGDDDEIIRNNSVNLKVDEKNKLFGINGKSSEISGH